MISFNKIIFGVILGSSLLIFIALQLFSPSEQVQASTISADQPTVILENEKPVRLKSCQISQKYPESIQQWCSSIQTNASKYSIDPNLLAAVMLQESGGDPNAFSSCKLCPAMESQLVLLVSMDLVSQTDPQLLNYTILNSISILGAECFFNYSKSTGIGVTL